VGPWRSGSATLGRESPLRGGGSKETINRQFR